MDKGTTYVGMDVHKRTIAVSIRYPGGGRDERTIPHAARSVNRLVRKLKREAPGAILCAYEAGPCGYGLQRARPRRGSNRRNGLYSTFCPELIDRSQPEVDSDVGQFNQPR